MKNLFKVFVLQAVAIFSLQAQPVSDYSYKLDNGINVKTEGCWNMVWVQQSYTALAAGDQAPLVVNIRTLGDLISGSAFKLYKSGKEAKMQGAAPGTYDLRLSFKLSGRPGTLSFVVGNIIIKPKTKTSVAITLYDYQILIEETKASLKGLSSYETRVNRCKSNTIQDLYFGMPTFYTKGMHDKSIPPAESSGKTSGKMKPGTYDLLISIGISGQTHKVWLENFIMKPDISYKISTNLNAGGISYTGGNKDIKAMHLYPAGTASRQKGNPVPVKNLETISYSNMAVTNCCSPGTYDVLLNFKDGAKYEWRNNIVVQTGSNTEIK
jgi:hypothetical protein